MESLKLSELEQRWYWELFQLCNGGEGCGILSGQQVSELFLTAGLPPEIVHQVVDICGAKRLGHFGPSQFFIALKLIAAAQNGLPVTLDICKSGMELPRPRFALHSLNAEMRRGGPMLPYSFSQGALTQPHIQAPSHGPQPPLLVHPPPHIQPVPVLASEQHFVYYDRPMPPNHAVSAGAAQPAMRTYQAPRSLSLAVGSDSQLLGTHDRGSPGSSPPLTSDLSVRKLSAPAAAVHVHSGAPATAGGEGGFVRYEGTAGPHPTELHRIDKGWASFEDEGQATSAAAAAAASAAAAVSERREWAQFADRLDTLSLSSEGTGADDAWCITDEQRDYYVAQFRTMQDDLRGVISGAVAKEFFEKSKLPVPELSKIWQLSDVNRDGALSLDEFCTAMHLVVLRRNDIDLPDTLPPSLLPYSALANADESYGADLHAGATPKRISPTSSGSSQWTFPHPSSTSSSVSSPSNKPTPVNFEFRPITADMDSRIVYPVAVRMSPDGQPYSEPSTKEAASMDGVRDSQTGETLVTPPGGPLQSAPPPVSAHLLIDLDLDPSEPSSPHPSAQLGAGSLHGRPRPTPKKAQSLPGTSQDALVMLPPPPVNQDPFATPTEERGGPTPSPPPPPPPRVHTGHSRSTSLDNQLIDFSDVGASSPNAKYAPPVPLRLSPKDTSFDSSPGGSSSALPHSLREGGAREAVGKKAVAPHISMSLDRKDLQSSIRNKRERNMVLSRLNNELNQELQEVMEQRIALEIQMEHLRPYHS